MLVSPTYDLEANAVYLRLGKGKVARTVDLDSGTLVDLDDSGRPLGIEVINPAREWPIATFTARFGADPALIKTLKVLARSFALPVRSFNDPSSHSTSGAALVALG